MTDAYVPEAGDVIWTDFDPPTGREQGGRRPALVVSPRNFYDGTRFVFVCPVTTRIRPFGSSVVLPPGFPIGGEILVAQTRCIDTLARAIRYSGASVPEETLSQVRRKLAFLCGVKSADIAGD